MKENMENNTIIRIDDRRTTDHFEIASFCGIGRRESQQDRAYCYADDASVYCVVCDGMGGLSGGELASATAVELAEVAYSSFRTAPPEDFQEAGWMAEVIRAADQAVFALKDSAGRPLGAGSTFLSAWIHQGSLYWASAGDSRMYLFQGNEAVQVTTDLNYFYILNQRLAEARITRAQYAEEAASGEHLVSFLGHGSISLLDCNTDPLPLLPGDTLLLCTDGLYRTVELSMMRSILSSSATLAEAARTLRQAVGIYDERFQDNFTCVMIKMKE